MSHMEGWIALNSLGKAEIRTLVRCYATSPIPVYRGDRLSVQARTVMEMLGLSRVTSRRGPAGYWLKETEVRSVRRYWEAIEKRYKQLGQELDDLIDGRSGGSGSSSSDPTLVSSITPAALSLAELRQSTADQSRLHPTSLPSASSNVLRFTARMDDLDDEAPSMSPTSTSLAGPGLIWESCQQLNSAMDMMMADYSRLTSELHCVKEELNAAEVARKVAEEELRASETERMRVMRRVAELEEQAALQHP
jgi:hypothetical protein